MASSCTTTSNSSSNSSGQGPGPPGRLAQGAAAAAAPSSNHLHHPSPRPTNQGPSPSSSFSAQALLLPPGKSTSMERRRQSPEDFLFGRLIGEGSFSSVFLAREVSSGKEFAIKVCDKMHILREKKQEYIHSEKRILVKIAAHWTDKVPFFVKIHSTFHDATRLYFVMTYAKNGDLLRFIDDMARRDIDCTQFYAGQLLSAVEFLHRLGIIHRDLKPENILLNERQHILITDFGSAKLLDDDDESGEGGGGGGGGGGTCEPLPKRRSFVGTAQYVSPEILNGRGSTRASDLWAIGCVLYQMLTGMPPFQSQSEYLIFQKIQQLEYSFHEGFDEKAKDLIQRLLVIDPSERLGARDKVLYQSIRAHPFFVGLDFDSLPESTPPSVEPYVPKENQPDPCWSRNPNIEPGADRLNRLMLDEGGVSDSELNEELQRALEEDPSHRQHLHMGSLEIEAQKKRNVVNLTDEEKRTHLEEQRKSNKFHRFVAGNLIIKQGILDKKKGLWARRRMFLLTEGPHLYYVDPDHMVLKGEIPWAPEIRPEVRDFKIFFVHTPNRVYYLIDPESTAKDWCHAINEVRKFYFGDHPAANSTSSAATASKKL